VSYKTKREWYASPQHYKTEKTWAEYKASLRNKPKRRTFKPRDTSYGLFSSRDIGLGAGSLDFGFGSSKKSRGYEGIGSFDFGGGFGGSSKSLTPKQQYFKEKRELDQRLESKRYGSKLQDIRAAKSRLNKAERDEMIYNVKSGFGKLTGMFKRRR